MEIGAIHQNLTAGYPDWNGGYLRGTMQLNPLTVWNAEVARQSEFGDHGTFYAAGATHTFSPDTFGSLTVGSSSGGFFFPKFRADASLSRKWLRDRRLVTSLGLGYYEAKDTHHDASAQLGATYYFKSPWVAEVGVRYNNSHPGSVNSRSQFIAITQGREHEHYIVLRLGSGGESYQLVSSLGSNPDATAVLADFYSHTQSLSWRQWLGRDWGVNVSAERYTNPSYHRTGVSIGTFKGF